MLLCRQTIFLILLTCLSKYAFAKTTPDVGLPVDQQWNTPAESNRANLYPSAIGNRYRNFALELGSINNAPIFEPINNFSTYRQTKSLASRVTGFTLSSQQAAEADSENSQGISENLIYGLMLEDQTLSNKPKHLYLAVEYLSGKSNNNETQASKSNAVGIMADSNLFAQQLHIRAEYSDATSNSDKSSTSPRITDNAHHLLINYSPKQLVDASINLNIGIENKKIGTFYNSLANPELTKDKDLIRTYLNTSWNEISLDLSYANTKNNVSNLSTQPTIKSDVTDIGLIYQPNWGASLFGKSSYSINYSRVKSQEIKQNTEATTTPKQKLAAVITLAVNFTYELWEWMVTYGSGSNEDYTNFQSNSELNFAELDLNFPIASRVSLTHSARREINTNTYNFIKSENSLYKLGLNAMIIRDIFNASINASLKQSKSDDDSTNRDESAISAEAVWNAVLPRGKIPAMNLALSANYSKSDDAVNPTKNFERYKVYLGLSVLY